MTAPSLSKALIEVGRRFYSRHWVLATSGNFSAVMSHSPLRLCITQSAAHKGTLTTRDFLTIDESARPIGRMARRPSAEARLHVAIVLARKAGAVLHTHSVWSTMLSDRHADEGGLALQGFEMLKALDGVSTHTHREWLPIVENDQDMARLAGAMTGILGDHPDAHGLLIRGHGLYTWGRTIAEAERHVEAFEFLLEVVARQSGAPGLQ
ncbi:MAG TPA: methylthioribulose 1-phosphate dehydratase [Vicinamibacterales bacterium]|nr:methylthioribulose 1-phosphate dehydratase [Vicinamibacterales bacterium]